MLISLYMGLVGANAQSNKYDLNDDGNVNIIDVMYVVNKILGHNNKGDSSVGEEVDLELPSGTIWASCNVGATVPEEVGGYFSWGETVEKSDYTGNSYQYYQNGSYVNIGSDISGTEYDVATALWGDGWCMPTKDQFNELIENCRFESTTINGMRGVKFISKINGNSIFLPCSGWYYKIISQYGNYGRYWSSTLSSSDSSRSHHMTFTSSSKPLSSDNTITSRSTGYSVRPVRSPIHRAIDLGLPSGIKWASCNIGAKKPEDFGWYLAWGELGEKLDYIEETYHFYDSQNNSYMPLGNDIGGTKYDAARMKWGGNWRMPTKDEFDELVKNCTHEFTIINGVRGHKFTSKINGNSIFMPAAGRYWDGSLFNVGSEGKYWSSTRNPSLPHAFSLVFYNDEYADWSVESRENGLCVRPVWKE